MAVNAVKTPEAEKISRPFLGVMKETDIYDAHIPLLHGEHRARNGNMNLWPPRCSQSPGTKTPNHVTKVH